MKEWHRKGLHAAVAASFGVMDVAHAVHVNPKHLGSVLIYPYYTVRAYEGGTSTSYFDNYLSVVNTTASTKAVKVRFLEGKRSAEVLSFNLFLSPFDVWTGGVVRTTNANEAQEGAKLVSTDHSCVVPNNLFSTASTNPLNRFSNFSYSGANADGGSALLDRAREGHLEVLEMGDVTNTTAIAAARHNSASFPANCAYFEANDATLATRMTPPSGGLYGALSLINVRAGTDYSYDAVALDNWSPAAVQYTSVNSPEASIAPAGASVVSTVFTADGVVSSTWPTSRDAVSAAMMQVAIWNEWVLETGTSSGTDWVVTFPTKRLYVSPGTGAAVHPFNVNFNNGSSCDAFTSTYYNREESTPVTNTIFCPCPGPVTPPPALCGAANVITFSNSNTLGSTNQFNVDTTAVGRVGHMVVNFELSALQFLSPAASTVDGRAVVPQRHFGLPVVGFMLQDYVNGNVGTPSVLSNYGGSFTHKYLNRITP